MKVILPSGSPSGKSTIDEAGRLVIPREVRRAAGLEAGMALDVRVEDGAVIIEAAPTPVTIKRRGRFVVAQPVQPLPALTSRAVEETRERISSERVTARGVGRGRKKV